MPGAGARLRASSSPSLGAALPGPARPAPPSAGPRDSPATPAPDPRARARHNAGPPGPWGCGLRNDLRAAELRARQRRRWSAPQRSDPLAGSQWELPGRLHRRPRGWSRGSPWETKLRLGLLTIAPPPASQSEEAETGAGRSELGWRVTTAARWVRALHPGPCRRPQGCWGRALRKMFSGLRRRSPGRTRAGSGGAEGRGTASEPLTKQLGEGRAASASSCHRPAQLPVTRQGGGGQ